MKLSRFLLPLVLLATAYPLLAQTQPPAAAEDDLKELYTKTDFTPDDTTRIREYIVKRVGLIVTKEADSARTGADSLRETFVKGGDRFKKEYAAACLETVGNAVKKADLEPATRLLAVVNTFNTIDALPVLLDALQDERVGVQAAGAVGLGILREKLAGAGREQFSRAVTALKETGKKTRSREVLRRVYEALDYTGVSNTPDAKADAAAVLEILEERANKLYNEAGMDVPGVGADDSGVHMLIALYKTPDEAERKRIVTTTAIMMRYAIEDYLNNRRNTIRDKSATREQIELRNGMERLVLVSEELLTALLKPPQPAPMVAEAMRKADPTKMANEWKKWVPLLQRETSGDFSLSDQAMAASTELARKKTADKDKTAKDTKDGKKPTDKDKTGDKEKVGEKPGDDEQPGDKPADNEKPGEKPADNKKPRKDS